MKTYLAVAFAGILGMAGAAHAQIAPGTYVGSVQFTNVCANGGQGFYAVPMRLVVSNNGSLTYLETDVTTQQGNSVQLPQGGFSIIKVNPNGSWNSQTAAYDTTYDGYSVQSGTWTQTFTNNTDYYSSSGPFDIVVRGQVVCSEPTNGTFILAPKGY